LASFKKTLGEFVESNSSYATSFYIPMGEHRAQKKWVGRSPCALN